MRAFHCHHFVLPLPPEHRFPMSKYQRLHMRCLTTADALGLQLTEPDAATVADLQRVHCANYIERMCSGLASAQEMRRIGFPWSAAMVERSRRSAGGTIGALNAALGGDGVAVNLAGGTHHAAFDRGGGYCVFNDTVIAARHAQHHGLARRLLVVDLDVHQGDGTAALCAADPTIFTFSMHGARNYPAIKPASDMDLGLPDGCADAQYLDVLAQHLPTAIARAEPDAVIYLAGADPYHDDRLGYLALTKPGLRERDRLVLRMCERAGLPLAISMAGGYAHDVEDIVDIHHATVTEAAHYFRRLAVRAATA